MSDLTKLLKKLASLLGPVGYRLDQPYMRFCIHIQHLEYETICAASLVRATMTRQEMPRGFV
jgi:hypothetical protein